MTWHYSIVIWFFKIIFCVFFLVLLFCIAMNLLITIATIVISDHFYFYFVNVGEGKCNGFIVAINGINVYGQCHRLIFCNEHDNFWRRQIATPSPSFCWGKGVYMGHSIYVFILVLFWRRRIWYTAEHGLFDWTLDVIIYGSLHTVKVY